MTTEQLKPKRIPYGKQNWEDVRLSNFYYVDKTHFIPEIEAANEYFFFIRPRRFGKSLLMSMLRQYYDIRKADSFDRLFGDLWIGQHPTPEHNTYLVLYLNFSAFSGDLEGYKERMDGYCRIQFEGFLRDYASLLPANSLDILRAEKGAANQLAAARETAIGQITRYAESVNVERTSGHTKVHRLILIWRGMNLDVAEELS